MALACQRFGSGPPLVLLHGLFGSGSNWRGTGSKLTRAHEVVTLDLPGHGRSEVPLPSTMASMAREVEAAVSDLGIDRPVLLGHSLGGRVAMEVALAGRQPLAALIVVDITARSSGDGGTTALAAMQATDPRTAARRAEIVDGLAHVLGDEALAAFLATNLERRGEGLAWRIDLDRFEAVLPALADWTPCGVAGLPALILRGGASPYVTADDIEALRVHFPALSAATIDGAGHWVHADRPAAFVAAVEEFLGSLAVGAGGREVR